MASGLDMEGERKKKKNIKNVRKGDRYTQWLQDIMEKSFTSVDTITDLKFVPFLFLLKSEFWKL